ncbi:MAG TPA: MerR family transcriptional regulator [Gammaproteobacteria bacterium]|nr:MerR family transcriptional regulator [Gammaproteobacteria bacterium]
MPIRRLAELSGVSATTLRAWERRYGLLRPARTAKGHRLYNADDVALVRRVVDLLEAGWSVRDAAARIREGGPPPATAPQEVWPGYRDRLLGAVARFDPQRLDAVYNEALSLYPVDRVTEDLVRPALRTLGAHWMDGETGIAEEHFLSAFLRNKLGARLHHEGRHPHGPRLVAATLPGERHELGFLMFCLAAVGRGYRLLYLGPDLPLAQVTAAATRTSAAGVLLSGTCLSWEAGLAAEVAGAAAAAPVPLFLGGPLAESRAETLAAVGVSPLGTRFRTALDRLDGHLAGR